MTFKSTETLKRLIDMDRIFKIDKQLCGKFHATYVEKVDEKHLVMHFDCPIVKRMTWDLITDAIDLYAWGLSWSSWLEKEARYHFNLAHFVLCKRDPFHDLRETLQDMYLTGEIRHNLIDIRSKDCGEVLGNRICLVFGPEMVGNYTPFVYFTPGDFEPYEFHIGTFYKYKEMGIAVTHYQEPHSIFGHTELDNICTALKDFYMNATEI